MIDDRWFRLIRGRAKALAGLLLGALLLAVVATPAQAQDDKRIALTFDDVPRHPGGFLTPDERTAGIIAGLREGGVAQAGFFVTTGNLEKDGGEGGEARIAAYVAAGHVIGNHSHSHSWLWNGDAAAYITDLDKAEAWLAGKPGRRPWYRFPYLDEGRDVQKRDTVRTALRQRGLMNAYVTIDDYDWAIDDLARKAMEAGRPIDRAALGRLYVETIVGTADFYDRMGRDVLGRAPAQVLLLHETDLAGLFIADLAKALRADGWTIVPIDEAYQDPIARTEPDTTSLGGGRLAALAQIAGRDPGTLVYERTNEEELARLFEDRVIVKERK